MLDRIRALRGEVGDLGNKAVVGVLKQVPLHDVSDRDMCWTQLQASRFRKITRDNMMLTLNSMLAYIMTLSNFDEYSSVSQRVTYMLVRLKKQKTPEADDVTEYQRLVTTSDLIHDVETSDEMVSIQDLEDPLAVRARQLARHGLIGPSQIPVMINCKSQPTLDAIASIASRWKQQNIGSTGARSQIECYLKTYVRAYNLAQHTLLDQSSKREVLTCTSKPTLDAIESIQAKLSGSVLNLEEASKALTKVLDANKLLAGD